MATRLRLSMRERSAWPWIERGCLALSVVALFAITWRNMDLLGDSFWALATGDWILDHRRLPTVDPFTFTAERTWIVQRPLSDIVFAAVERHAGVLALELFGSAVFAGSLAVLWLPHARGFVARALVWPLAVWLVVRQSADLCVRGQIFGDLCYAILLLLLFRLRDGRRVHWAVPVVLGSAWINLHASAFLCVALPVLFGFATLSSAADRRSLRPWLSFAALAGIGMLLNPYGYRLVADLVRLMGARSTRDLDLFRPPDFGTWGTWLSVLLVLAVVAGCVAVRSVRAGTAEALVLGVLLAAGCAARRYEPLALGFAVAVSARLFQERLPRASRFVESAALALGTAAVGLSFYGISADKDPWRDVPAVEARLIESLNLPDRVANAYHWGGYLDYAWAGRRKAFIDGRNQLFDRRVFADHRRIGSLDGWQGLLDRYGINTVLWERGSPLDWALARAPDWVQVRRGRIAVLYVRRGAWVRATTVPE